MTDEEVVEVRTDPNRRRFEVFVDDSKAGYASFRDDAGVRTFFHTEIKSAYEGHGLGGRLIRQALDDTRASGLLVDPQCPFVRTFIDQHPEYGELVAAAKSPNR
jgi:predicted GNAT family acetyltransferase